MTPYLENKTVLLVEDNPDDVFLMRRVFQKAKIDASLEILTDGRRAVEYLQDKIGQTAAAIPSFAFLDLKLPYLGGFEILEWIRQQPKLGDLPVVILTSSLEDKDREKALALGVEFFVKPPTPELIQRVLSVLKQA